MIFFFLKRFYLWTDSKHPPACVVYVSVHKRQLHRSWFKQCPDWKTKRQLAFLPLRWHRHRTDLTEIAFEPLKQQARNITIILKTYFQHILSIIISTSINIGKALRCKQQVMRVPVADRNKAVLSWCKNVLHLVEIDFLQRTRGLDVWLHRHFQRPKQQTPVQYNVM